MNRVSKLAFTAVFTCAALIGSAFADPITVQTANGPLTLPQPARRVIALEYSYLDTLEALGVKAVGAATTTQGGDRGVPDYLRARTRGVTAVGSRAQPNLEAAFALKPDLILADTLGQKTALAALGRIAPTAAYDNRRGSYDDVLAQVLDIGRLVGREAQARQLLAEQANLRAKASAFTKKSAPGLVVAVATEGSFTVHSSDSFIGSLLGKLGRRNLAAPQGGNTQYDLSLEGLVALNPGTLVVLTGADETPTVRAWAKTPLWQKLSAVQRGRVYEFDRDLWTRSRGPIALRSIFAQMISSGLLGDRTPTAPYQFRP
ncbi:ABC transporter substrate-binding protein [Deinococcus ruber]|uniref:Iron siderophore-binding protein n=1 Tax=Deinococcus ruber TaxID=1848197 RepID=A0A918CI12_9DEIO|nr:ABC transporter substrate-binding protein [Deinococcus ruber]GGR23999.1 iron siderophore-binding protein [Deinococcus ruber]